MLVVLVTYAAKGKLDDHIQSVHDKKKPFKCTTCEKHFAKKDNLKTHVKRIHEGKKTMFSCTICDTSFERKDRLKNHVATVHEGNLGINAQPSCDTVYYENQTVTKDMVETSQKHSKFPEEFLNRKFMNIYLKNN